MSLNSSGGAINVGNDAVAQAINVGTGAAARTITVGNDTGATAVNVTTGSGGLTMTTGTNGAISIDPHGTGNLTLGSADNATTSLNGNAMNVDAAGALQVNSSGGAISIANDNVDQTVNLATAGTRTLNIGINDGTVPLATTPKSITFSTQAVGHFDGFLDLGG